ncbi:restriction endonuclease subunit S [Paraclostridium bifermentans]|uniref:restriction endonuclease subunit S n=1 Tax=Paraclostridium bifermentans TaxID=1490 RepID=UPI001F425FDC|nr:restriction endonuclease subunit S [Paraclostridium bifermentans]MCE9674424.1 restriction endonuclease subunit S [Paraclostridium bifermentans]
MGIKKMKIKEFAEVVSGSTPKTKVDEYWNGEYFWITPAEIKEGDKYINYTSRTITKEGINSCSLRELRPNTVLLSSRAPIGKVALLGNSMYCNQGFKNLICNEEIVNPEYIYYWLSSKKEYLNSLGRGATFKEISKKIVEDIEVPVQTLEEQKKIVNVLNKAQELIDKRKEQIEFLDELVKSRFIEMFGDPYLNPKSFNIVKMTDITSVVTCGVAARPEYVSDGVPFLSSQNVGIREIFLDKLKFISDEAHNKLTKNNKPENGDILYTRVGSQLGKAAIVDLDFEFSVYVSLTLIKPLHDRVNNEYLVNYLNLDRVQRFAKGNTTGIGVPNLNVDVVREYNIPLPPMEHQNDFADFVKQVDKLKFEMENSLKELENNFNSLMQKAFKGELFQ